MSKILKTFVGARFINPLTASYLAAVGEFEGQMIYVDLTDPRVSDPTDENAIAVVGIAIPFADLQERKFAAALPVEPRVGYNAVVLNSKGAEPGSPNGLIFGQIVALSDVAARVRHAATGNLFTVPVQDLVITRAPRTGDDLTLSYPVGSEAVIVDRSDVLGRGVIVTILEEQGELVGFTPVDDVTGNVYVATKASIAPIVDWDVHVALLGPVDRNATLQDVPASALENASLGIELPSTEGLFGAQFVPANDEVSEEGKSLIGAVFSMKELELIVNMVKNGASEDAFANLLGISLLQGRKIDEDILRAIIEQEIPYGLHAVLPSGTEFFEEIGRIAIAQTQEVIRRVFDAMQNGGTPDVKFESPSHIAFVRLTGIDPSQPNPPAPPVEATEESDNLSIAAFLDNRISEGNFTGVIDNEALIQMFEAQGYNRADGPLAYKISILDEAGNPMTPTGVQELAEALKADGLSFEQLVAESLNDQRPLVPHAEAVGRARDAIQQDGAETVEIVGMDGLVDFLNSLVNDGVVVLPPNDGAIVEALADAAAQKAVEEGGGEATAFDKLLSDTLGEFTTLAKIGQADAKMLAHDLTDITKGLISDIEASVHHVSNIASNVAGLADYANDDRSAYMVNKTKSRLTSLLNRIENVGKLARILNDSVVNAATLGEGFAAIEGDVEALKALKG